MRHAELSWQGACRERLPLNRAVWTGRADGEQSGGCERHVTRGTGWARDAPHARALVVWLRTHAPNTRRQQGPFSERRGFYPATRVLEHIFGGGKQS